MDKESIAKVVASEWDGYTSDDFPETIAFQAAIMALERAIPEGYVVVPVEPINDRR